MSIKKEMILEKWKYFNNGSKSVNSVNEEAKNENVLYECKSKLKMF